MLSIFFAVSALSGNDKDNAKAEIQWFIYSLQIKETSHIGSSIWQSFWENKHLCSLMHTVGEQKYDPHV